MSGEEHNDIVRPALESLEQRLLLTTLTVGDYFLYHNTKGEVVRIDLIDPTNPNVTAELFAHESWFWPTGIVDLPGILGSQIATGTYGAVLDTSDGDSANWFWDWSEVAGGRPLAGKADNNAPGGWTFVEADWVAPNLGQGVQGSWTEIYAIYIPNATAYTQLLVTVLSNNGLHPGLDGELVNGFGGATPFLNVAYRNPDPDSPGFGAVAPGGTGGVLIGALHSPWSQQPDTPSNESVFHYWGVNYESSFAIAAHGVFPGGTLYAGIWVNQGSMENLLVQGTVAGLIRIPGNLERAYIGFLWGNAYVGANVGTLVLKGGSGSVGEGSIDSTIYVSGKMNFLDVPTGNLDSNILVENDVAWVYSPWWSEGTFDEFKFKWAPTDIEPIRNFSGWLYGYWLDYGNDSLSSAYYLTSPTGRLTVWGKPGAFSSNTDEADEETGIRDYYAVSMLAGQTITVSGGVDPIFPDQWLWSRGQVLFGFVGSGIGVYLVDSSGQVVDTLGRYTEGNKGFGGGDKQVPITFTAPEAGVYYIVVATRPTSPVYTLFIDGLDPTALGAIRVSNGDFGADQDARDQGSYLDVMVGYGGGLGAIDVAGSLHDMFIYALDGGNLAVVRANDIDTVSITANSNIGLIRTEGDAEGLLVQAGLTKYNDNAFIQNVFIGGDFGGGTLYATGSIGVIEVEGLFAAVDIRVNSDGVGPAGRIDLINVGGDWGDNRNSAPTLTVGYGGNVGYLRIGGDFWQTSVTGWQAQVLPTQIPAGGSVTLNDDGGGKLTIEGKVPMLDEQGRQMWDETGQLMWYMTAFSYLIIPVNGGAGGVIADITADGPIKMTATGEVHISNLNMNGSVSIGGSGICNIYYVTSGGRVESFTNTTTGGLVSGSFPGIDLLKIKGSIGAMSGTTGAWLPGLDPAPLLSEDDVENEAQFGWFHGRINGLSLTADSGTISAGGAIGDLRITGNIEQIIADNDGVTTAHEWHGLAGVIWASGYIRSIAAGDGLASNGGGQTAKAGIFCSGWIGSITISGPRYVAGTTVFGELNGVIIAQGNGLPYTVEDEEGNITEEVTDAIGRIVGTNGATLTAWVICAQLDSFATFGGRSFSGGIGTISFSGPGAKVYNTSIIGQHIKNISTSRDSDGIYNVSIHAGGSYSDMNAVGRITAGGPGLIDCQIYVASGRIGPISGVGENADIRGNAFQSPGGIISISGRDISNNSIATPGKIDSITATRNFLGNDTTGLQSAYIGGLGRLTVGKDFMLNYLAIAGGVDSVTIKGQFIQSALIITGADAYLKSMTVGGDIDEFSQIASAGRVGKIIVNGQVRGDISTTSSGRAGDLDVLRADGGYVGNLDVGGRLGTFTTKMSLGLNPMEFGYTQTFNIWGDVGLIRVQAVKDPVTKKLIPANLYANINVGGNIKKIQVDGTLYGNIRGNGDLDNLILRDGLGFYDAANDVKYGSVNILGTLKKLKFNRSEDLVADLTLGGSLKSLAMKGGDIIGNITMLSGTLGTLSTKNGSIKGDVLVRNVGKVSVVGGDLSGNLTVTGGSVKSITVKGGNLLGDVWVANGSINSLTVTGSLDGVVSASGNLKKVQITGEMNGDLLAGGVINTVKVKGGNIAGLISGEYGVGTVTTDKALLSVIRSGGNITKVTLGSMGAGSIISAAHNIGTVSMKGDMAFAMVLAGYDVGVDGLFGTADDNPLTGSVHSGSIKSLTVGGAFDSSVVSAGVNPDTGDEAPGVSSIVKMKVGRFVNPAASKILADTSIDAKFLRTIDTRVEYTRDTQKALPVDVSNFAKFGPGIDRKNTTYFAGGLSFSLTGAGIGYYDDVTHTLYLAGTTSKSKLTISGDNAVGLTIIGQDDAGLGQLKTGVGVALERVEIDGVVGQVVLGQVVSGEMFLPGGLNKGTVVSLAPTSTFGDVGSLTVQKGTSGSLVSDTIKSLTVGAKKLASNSNMDFPVNVLFGGIGTLTVHGSLASESIFRGDVNRVTVQSGDVNGVLSLYAGNLSTLRSTGQWDGVVDVQRGLLGSATFGKGLGTQSEIHTSGGINKITAKGDLAGVIATRGNLGSVSTKGALTGRIGAAGSGKSLSVGSMNEALVTYGGDLATVKITGDMIHSMILAGYDTGDAGYQPGISLVNAAQLDTTSVSPGNEDRLSSGSIKTVTIGGRMERSSIGAGVSPGVDGMLGSDDDVVSGMGRIGKVAVRGTITGSAHPEFFGIVAASNLPVVTMFRQPYAEQGNMVVRWATGMAGDLRVTGVDIRGGTITIYFNHPLDMSTVDTVSGRDSTLRVWAADDLRGLQAGDYDAKIGAGALDVLSLLEYNDYSAMLGGGEYTVSYDAVRYSVTITLGNNDMWGFGAVFGQWDFYGSWLMVELVSDRNDPSNSVRDNRYNILDGEYRGSFLSGNGHPGGNFEYIYCIGTQYFDIDSHSYYTETLPRSLGAATMDPSSIMPLVPGGGPLVFSSAFTSTSGNTVNVVRFAGTQYEYFSAELATSAAAGVQMALFYYEDGYHKMVTRTEWNTMPGQSLFTAFELPVTGDYYLAYCLIDGSPFAAYSLTLNYAESDLELVSTQFNGHLPRGGKIAYVSNTLGEHNNLLGFNMPKQLVYLDFTGGTATKYVGFDAIPVSPFRMVELDPTLAGYEDTIINGGIVGSGAYTAGVTGIVDYVMEIYRSVPATMPATWTVERIVTAMDWSNYAAASNGLYFTTVDPATIINPETGRRYDAEVDFTTVFIGQADRMLFQGGSGLMGIASQVDLANMSKADNAIVFAQSFVGLSVYESSRLSWQVAGRLEEYSKVFANVIAHELGHTLGLNHQDISYLWWGLQPDYSHGVNGPWPFELIWSQEDALVQGGRLAPADAMVRGLLNEVLASMLTQSLAPALEQGFALDQKLIQKLAAEQAPLLVEQLVLDLTLVLTPAEELALEEALFDALMRAMDRQWELELALTEEIASVLETELGLLEVDALTEAEALAPALATELADAIEEGFVRNLAKDQAADLTQRLIAELGLVLLPAEEDALAAALEVALTSAMDSALDRVRELAMSLAEVMAQDLVQELEPGVWLVKTPQQEQALVDAMAQALVAEFEQTLEAQLTVRLAMVLEVELGMTPEDAAELATELAEGLVPVLAPALAQESDLASSLGTALQLNATLASTMNIVANTTMMTMLMNELPWWVSVDAMMSYMPIYNNMTGLSYLGVNSGAHFATSFYVDTLTQLSWWLT